MFHNKRNLILVSLSIVAILAFGAFAVFAQDATEEPQPPYAGCPMMNGGQGMMGQGMGMMGGYGMMGQGMGMMGNWDSSEHPMFAAIAGALGLTTDELLAEFQAGKTLTEIATEQNVDIQTVYDAALAVHEAHLASLVEAGTISQEQADAHLAWWQENIANMPMFNGTTGNCAGMGNGRGMMGGHGMMGRGGR